MSRYSWEEFVELVELLVKFQLLKPEQKEQVFLMMDGMKWRQTQSSQEQRCEHE